MRLPDLTSIFRAELYALFLAIDVIRRSKLKKFVIFPDSLSSLQAIAGFNIDHRHLGCLLELTVEDHDVTLSNNTLPITIKIDKNASSHTVRVYR